MSTSRTTTVGSIPITGGTSNQPSAPTCPTTPSASDEERELERQLKCNQERLQALKEKRKAEEAAKKQAEEEAARRAAEEEKKQQEAAEKRRRVTAARSRQGPSPNEATTSARRVEVEIPWVVKKGKGRSRTEASGGDPDNGNDGNDDKDRAPCPVFVLGPYADNKARRVWREDGRHGESNGAGARQPLGFAGGPFKVGDDWPGGTGDSEGGLRKAQELEAAEIVEESEEEVEEQEEEEVEKGDEEEGEARGGTGPEEGPVRERKGEGGVVQSRIMDIGHWPVGLFL
ncbi:hypothetical protein EV359DRAFT_88102 [Lentinula novae-zelandiae]|nr:hypothetical protein EV359DRAFT_88102 [Lentinula novae-zelandiae]